MTDCLFCKIIRFRAVCGREEPRGVPREDVLGEQPRVEVRFVKRNAGVAEPLPCGSHASVDGGYGKTAVASLSFSDW